MQHHREEDISNPFGDEDKYKRKQNKKMGIGVDVVIRNYYMICSIRPRKFMSEPPISTIKDLNVFISSNTVLLMLKPLDKTYFIYDETVVGAGNNTGPKKITMF